MTGDDMPRKSGSGDRHLLNLGQYEGIVILSPAEFMARFNETSSIR
jgi:hypothetical protein